MFMPLGMKFPCVWSPNINRGGLTCYMLAQYGGRKKIIVRAVFYLWQHIDNCKGCMLSISLLALKSY